ncbi:hypothetical protein C0995_007806, partial [Termitomyces sp. Mi166
LSLQEQEEVHAVTMPTTQGQPSQHTPTCNKGKAKAKVMEENEDDEDETTENLREELENFVVPTKFSEKDLAGLLPLPMEYYEGDLGLL